MSESYDEVASNDVVCNTQEVIWSSYSILLVLESQTPILSFASCVFFLLRASKQCPKGPENVDALVNAKISSTENQELIELVLKHSTHTPCGPLHNPSAVCMKY